MLSVTNCTTANIGTLNPFRYRSYYYDTETGLYYLQTRYYDPETGRFINSDSLSYLGDGNELSNYNLFAYCGNNPVFRTDSTGHFWREVWDEFAKNISELGGLFVVAGEISQADTPAIGPADAVALFIIVGTLAVCAGGAIYTVATAPSEAISIEKEKGKDVIYPDPNDTIIYRYGGTNPSNLTPRTKDKYSGLSFSTIPRPGAAMTTIEALNATGVVYAVQDGPFHVSVRPVDGTMEDWINEGSSSKWTQAVKSVVVKYFGD